MEDPLLYSQQIFESLATTGSGSSVDDGCVDVDMDHSSILLTSPRLCDITIPSGMLRDVRIPDTLSMFLGPVYLE
jgi:hypothetical protein